MVSVLAKHNLQRLQCVQWVRRQPITYLVCANPGECMELSSSQGVGQGDLMGPYVFSLASRSTAQALAGEAGQRPGKVHAYLHDVFCILPDADDQSFVQVSEIVRTSSLACSVPNRSQCAHIRININAVQGLPTTSTVLRNVRCALPHDNASTMLQDTHACSDFLLQYRLHY